MLNIPNDLPNDLILSIAFNLNNVTDVINLSSINRNIYKLFDDNFYLCWARIKYSDEFWDKANKRSVILSKPLQCMKFELLRLYNFNESMRMKGLKLWTNEDYYKYWKIIEDYRSRKNLTKKLNLIKDHNSVRSIYHYIPFSTIYHTSL